jgi:hypothetical protein
MNTDWLLLAAALGGLVLPLPAFYSRKNSYRALAELDIERRNGSWWLTWRKVLRFPGHWIELVRGLAAAWAALETVDQLESVSELYREHAAWAGSVIPLIAAFVSVVLISLLFRSPGKSLAPIFFVGASLLILVPPAVTVPALLLAVSATFALKSLAAFFGTAAVALALLGFLLDRNLWPSLAGAVFALTPLLLAAGRHHELVIPIRRGRSA